MFLKVSPSKRVIKFGKRGKLELIFIGLFKILKKVGEVAYDLALPPELSHVHNVFHISMLRRYIRDPSHVLDYIPLDIQDDLYHMKSSKS